MGVKNLAQFNRTLDGFLKDVGEQAVLFQKKAAFMVLGAFLSNDAGIRAHVGLLQLTPVDTGRAVGNWIVSIGAPAAGEVAGDFGAAGGGEVNRSAAVAKVSMQGARALGGLRKGQSIWIVNNLPYIVVLNDGATNRVAHHMLERALDNTTSALRAS